MAFAYNERIYTTDLAKMEVNEEQWQKIFENNITEKVFARSVYPLFCDETRPPKWWVDGRTLL